MLTLAQELHAYISVLHEGSYRRLSELKAVTARISEIKELVDIAYALNESEKLMKDLEKEIRKFRETVSKAVCALWAQNMDVDAPSNIKTDHVTATPDIKFGANIPSKRNDPAAYTALMQWLGVPEHLYVVNEDQHQVVDVHWPGLVDYVSAAIAEGKPLPDGIDTNTTYPIYKLTLRGRKEVRYTPVA